MATTIEIVRRDDVTINCTFKDAAGAAINITGYTVYFTVKRNIKDADSAALISKTVTSHSSPTTGQTTITLSKTNTNLDEGSYFYDFQLKDTSGNIQSTKRGTINVVQDITVGTS